MPNVQFEETSQFNLENSDLRDPKIISFLIKKHIARNRSQAMIIISSVCIVVLALSAFVIYKVIGSATKPVIQNNLSSSIKSLISPKNATH